jgi:hypothetical protein
MQNAQERKVVKMLTQNNPVISRLDVIGSLAHLREEWQEAVDGESLIDVQASVGLLLGDVVMLLGLSADEQAAVLGEELRRDFIQELRNRD